jgi:hypothetical protein
MSELCTQLLLDADLIENGDEPLETRHTASLLRRASARIDTLQAACLEARSVFQEYVRLHRAKNPPDEAKAQANFAHAERLGAALTNSTKQAAVEK